MPVNSLDTKSTLNLTMMKTTYCPFKWVYSGTVTLIPAHDCVLPLYFRDWNTIIVSLSPSCTMWNFFFLLPQSYFPKDDVEPKTGNLNLVGLGLFGSDRRCGVGSRRRQKVSDGFLHPPAGSHGAGCPLPLLLLQFLPSFPPPTTDCPAFLPPLQRGEEMRPCDSKWLQAGGIMEG